MGTLSGCCRFASLKARSLRAASEGRRSAFASADCAVTSSDTSFLIADKCLMENAVKNILVVLKFRQCVGFQKAFKFLSCILIS